MAHFALMSFHTIQMRASRVWWWGFLRALAGYQKLAQMLDSELQQWTRLKVAQKTSTFINAKALQLKLLKEYLAAEADTLVHAHFAPSCGTASRAREKRIPHLPLDRQPRPLRSDDSPEGLPNLSPKDAERVRLANISYDATMDLIEFLVGLGVSCSVENPTNSLFWKYVTVRCGIAAIGGFLRRSIPVCMEAPAINPRPFGAITQGPSTWT